MTEQTVSLERVEDAAELFGSFDEHIRIIERELGVSVVNRDSSLKVSGDGEAVLYGVKAIQGLLELSGRGEPLNEQNVRYVLQLVKSGQEDKIGQVARDVLCVTAKGKPIKPKTLGQKRYVDAIKANTVTLGIGPAGTGKTYLAVAAAVAAFRAGQINRIILTRPAVEAGERLGFLPGIILDEAQNTSREQMKMFLTRMGFGSKVVITGDVTQIDLPADKVSGLREAMRVLNGVEDIAICRLSGADVVRHVIVQRIIKAYEEDEHRRRSEEGKRK